MNVKSPVTYSFNTSFVNSFNVASIRQQYLEEVNVDTERFFEGLAEIDLYKCNDTGYRFYHPDGIWGDGRFYEELQKKNSWYYAKDRWEHRKGIALIHAGEKVLEIGCGDGVFLELLKAKGIQSIEAIELNESAVVKLKEVGYNIHNETIETFAPKQKEQYDVVCFFQVLEHIYNIKSFLDSALLTLKKGGRMIIAVPHNNPYLLKYDINHTLNLPPHHAGLWNHEAFENLQKFFSMTLTHLSIMPVVEYKEWYRIQRNHYKKTNPLKSQLMGLVPRPLYKLFLSVFKQPGRNILVEFTKK
ncbi:MAG: class I SAM-dependent methyltransferase [Ferruginibacter sp.]